MSTTGSIRRLAFAGTFAFALLLGPVAWGAVAPPALVATHSPSAPAASPPSATATHAAPARPMAPADTDSYARRDVAADPALAHFQGGDAVTITGSTLALVVLLIVIILI